MSPESNGTGTEPTLPRTREPTDPNRRVQRGGLFTYLDGAVWFRPAITLVPVVAAAVALAPRLGSRSYPTDPRLVGTPATENVKSPRDLTVEDVETTARLKGEAEARVRRVYDFDAGLGPDVGKSIRSAFAAVDERVHAYIAEHPELSRQDRLSRSARARMEADLQEIFADVRPEVERLLGEPLTDEERSVLAAAQYNVALGETLARIMEKAESEPIIARPVGLEPDRERGITIQRVPDDGSSEQVVEQVDSIATIDHVRDRIRGQMTGELPSATQADRRVLAGLLQRMIQPNLTRNRAATETARELAKLGVKPVTINIKKGEMILRDGERMTTRHLLIFAALSKSSRGASTALVASGAGALVLIMLLVGFGFGLGRGRHWMLDLSARDTLLLAALFAAMLATFRLWLGVSIDVQEALFSTIPLDVFLFAVPVAAGAMITRLVLRLEAAMVFAVVGGLVLGIMADGEPDFLLYAVLGSVVGATAIRTISRRSDLLRAGVAVGAAQAALAIALLLLDAQQSIVVYLVAAGASLVSGLLAAIVALAMTSVVETLFGYSTDLKLLELANLNHPALKELIVQAPGSYHHSIIVGSLVEAAAEAVGANPLLARVMAYYHDLGKGCNPGYFIENQRGGQNPHAKLKPSMSAMVIRRHVTDGVEIAKRYGLGEQILAAVIEHHGTTLIHYFFEKAKESQTEDTMPSASDYRYPGRKPQSRETAIVMLGDSVEAASRSLPEPTPARLQGLVNRIINLKFTDGQLDECDLTLKDLHLIAKSFTRILNSIYHERPEYPGLLTDLTGKKQNGDSDSKPPKSPEGGDPSVEEDRPDNIRRLGLDGR